MLQLKIRSSAFLICLFIVFKGSIVFAQQLSLKVAGDDQKGYHVDIFNGKHLVVTNTEEFSLQLYNLDLSTVANLEHWTGQKWTGNENDITLTRDMYIREFDADLSVVVNYRVVNANVIKKTVQLYQPSMPGMYYILRETARPAEKPSRYVTFAAKRVQNAGLKLGYHNHNFEFEPVEGQMLMEALLKNTDPDLLDFEMDVYWVVRAGQDPIQWLENYPGRFKLIHAKDMDKADPKLNTEMGSGSIDFKKIFEVTQSEGVKYYIVEQENYKIDPYVSIGQSNKYLRDTL